VGKGMLTLEHTTTTWHSFANFHIHATGEHQNMLWLSLSGSSLIHLSLSGFNF
jgi:hypothetical protein